MRISRGERELSKKVQIRRRFRGGWAASTALAVMALCWLPAGCRRESLWSGAEYTENGSLLRLSSEEPFCGKLDIMNVSMAKIYVRSRVVLDNSRPVQRGGVTLEPGETHQERFDWAGLGAHDVYLLDAWTAGDGKPLKIQDEIRINSIGWPFSKCSDETEGTIGSLYMNTGNLYHH